MKDGVITSEFPKVVTKILPGQESNFATGFMGSLISKTEHTLTVRTAANITVYTTGQGPFVPKTFQIVGLAAEAQLLIKGCGNFPTTPFLKQINFTLDATTGVYTLTSLVNIINPSSMVLTLGDVTYQNVAKNGLVFGTSFFPKVQLAIGDNPITMITTFTSKEVYDALTTQGYDFTLKGFEGSSLNPILAEALKAVASDMNIPKVTPPA